jgi:hypothetical protein
MQTLVFESQMALPAHSKYVVVPASLTCPHG